MLQQSHCFMRMKIFYIKNMKSLQRFFYIGLSLWILLIIPLNASDHLIVHEWGTFTSLQDDQGQSIGAINSDDEPVPSFVHRISALDGLPTSDLTSVFDSRAIIDCNLNVAMRSETPLIYFYPPSGQRQTVDVKVQFNGGWLTEFYPKPTEVEPALDFTSGSFPKLENKAKGSLEWRSVQINANGKPMITQDSVWLSPRKVKAALVKSSEEGTDDEVEKFLFYRGVGHLDSPVRIMRNAKTNVLQIQLSSLMLDRQKLNDFSVPAAWLIKIRNDKTCAFRSIALIDSLKSIEVSANFEEKEFSKIRLTELKNAMHKALVADGLFDEEAKAMLKTWELSYFKSPGLRFFYIVPHLWTDFD